MPVGVLPSSWAFSSGNADLVYQSTQLYSLPVAAAVVLFTLVVVGELTVAALFWRAVRSQGQSPPGPASDATAAFGAGLAFFGAMLLADEIFVVYRVADIAVTHWGVFIAQLVSMMVVRQSFLENSL